MSYQYWKCHSCDLAGVIRYQRGADVWDVAQRLGANHRKKNELCADTNGSRYVIALHRKPKP